MSWKTDVLPKRKSPRISGYDYGTPNYYFITVCTHEKQCLFGDPEKLNCDGIIVKKCLEKIPSISSGIMLEKYVVMPNHIHAILVIQGEEKSDEYLNCDWTVQDVCNERNSKKRAKKRSVAAIFSRSCYSQ